MSHTTRDDERIPLRTIDRPTLAEPFLAFLLSNADESDQHFCARCGMPIEDPLEECPTCAAEFGNEEEI